MTEQNIKMKMTNNNPPSDSISAINPNPIINSDHEKKEKKTYINCYCCNISLGIIYTYLFILSSISINIVNRVIFLRYNFKFNLFLILLQQIFCSIMFYILSIKSEIFKKNVGEVSFNDFLNLKYKYIAYTIFFIIKTVNSFLGYQWVVNVPMYVNLRRFLTTMTFIYDYCFKKKKITKTNILVVFLLTLGALLAGIDDYTTDYKGYLVVFLKNSLGLINLQISENFKKNNGVTNLKLLVYNSFLSTPILLIGMIFSGEFFRLFKYFIEDEHDFSYFSLIWYLLLSCSIVLFDNSTFFMSNEKNNSLFTQLLSDSKYIFVTYLSYKAIKTFEFTWKNILGLIISTSAAIIISVSSLYNNIQKANKNKVNEDNLNTNSSNGVNIDEKSVNVYLNLKESETRGDSENENDGDEAKKDIK